MTLSKGGGKGSGPPAGETATWPKTWEYWYQWHGLVPSTCTGSNASVCEASTHWWWQLTFPGTDPTSWTADSTPSPVTQPVLFFYAPAGPHFFSDAWLQQVDKAVPVASDHWMPCREGAAGQVNAEMAAWLR